MFISIALVFCISFSHTLYSSERKVIQNLAQYIPLSTELYEMLSAISSNNSMRNQFLSEDSCLLFAAYPHLKDHIPYISLGNFPTPIHEMLVNKEFNACVFIKLDGLSGRKDGNRQHFGGNKIRKLEFLLADAMAQGFRSVMTFGCTGSNHVVATASCSKLLDMHCIAMLTPQPPSNIVTRNRNFMEQLEVNVVECSSRADRTNKTIDMFVQNKLIRGQLPYFIPTGGSCPIGILGFVNAAFELKEQIKRNILPEPDYIYVACGSGGTVAGLLLGLKAVGLKTQVKAIAVEPDDAAYPLRKKLFMLFHETNELLYGIDPRFPQFDLTEDEIDISFEHTGSEYGLVTPYAEEAMHIMFIQNGIRLDPTYTGKAYAGLLSDLREKKLEDKTVLFWNTFCDYQLSFK